MNIGICLGDVAGIGPEVVVKALASGAVPRAAACHIIGDASVVAAACQQSGVRLNPCIIAPHHDRLLARIPFGRVNPRAARAAVAWIEHGARLCREGTLDALVTAPVNKQGLWRAGVTWPGQTEWLAHLTGARRHAMMLVGGKLRVALVTTHVPLRKVSRQLSTKKILDVIELTDAALQRLGLDPRRIGVAGLNPHAGENGLLGTEERTVIGPSVKAARRRGLTVSGPVPADTLFHEAYEGRFDAVVATYHDQGLAPLKMLAFHSGVNVTLGLPFIRTSPDHGTAYDIAGQGIANPKSMIEAIRWAVNLTRHKGP